MTLLGKLEKLWHFASRGRSGSVLFGSLCLFPFLHGVVQAQADRWDSLLQDSYWYVPAENLLAYLTAPGDLSDVTPVADQTLWSIGNAQNGVFSGNSVATFFIGPISSTSVNAMDGLVTEGGQIRIAFTSASGGPSTVGIGQMREVNGETAMEMQMISGSDGVYLTHWAYMLSYDGNPDSLPDPEIESSLRSEEWKWMKGTEWSLRSPSLFGGDDSTTFRIDDYRNGYFWGRSEAGESQDFSLIGSSTPEGNVLFSLYRNGELTSLTGQLSGDPASAEMVLRTYDPLTGFGDLSQAVLIPEPGTAPLLLALAIMVLGRRRRR